MIISSLFEPAREVTTFQVEALRQLGQIGIQYCALAQLLLRFSVCYDIHCILYGLAGRAHLSLFFLLNRCKPILPKVKQQQSASSEHPLQRSQRACRTVGFYLRISKSLKLKSFSRAGFWFSYKSALLARHSRHFLLYSQLPT